MKCKSCRHYSDWNILYNESESWCDRKNCFIARPNEYSCYGFEDRFFMRLWKKVLNIKKRFLSVRNMFGR